MFLGHRPCQRSHSEGKSEDLVVFSTPSGQHSRKPPIGSLLVEQLFNATVRPQCLELFARNLVPGWLVAGNEPLAHQSATMFV